MRELPEPDHTESVQMSEGGKDWVRHVDLFTRDQVLAIQKQAYEDGLRDAWNKVDANLIASDPQWRNGMVLATNLIAEVITASQEKE